VESLRLHRLHLSTRYPTFLLRTTETSFEVSAQTGTSCGHQRDEQHDSHKQAGEKLRQQNSSATDQNQDDQHLQPQGHCEFRGMHPLTLRHPVFIRHRDLPVIQHHDLVMKSQIGITTTKTNIPATCHHVISSDGYAMRTSP